MIFKNNFYRLPIFLISLFYTQTSYTSNPMEEKKNDLLYTMIMQEKLNDQSLQQEYLKLIEKNIDYIIQNLPDEQRKLLGNWHEKFEKFKKILTLVKPETQKLLTAILPLSAPYSFFGDEFLFTILGLKPLTFSEQGPNMLDQSLILDLKKLYPHELLQGSYTDSHTNIYLANKNPLISPDFVIDIYKNTIELSSPFNWRHILGNQKSIADFQKSSKRSDDSAIIYGYAPTWFKFFDIDFNKEKNILGKAPLLNPEYSINFRNALLPGNIAYYDYSLYVQLYANLIEYTWIYLFGLQVYINKIEAIIKRFPKIPTFDYMPDDKYIVLARRLPQHEILKKILMNIILETIDNNRTQANTVFMNLFQASTKDNFTDHFGSFLRFIRQNPNMQMPSKINNSWSLTPLTPLKLVIYKAATLNFSALASYDFTNAIISKRASPLTNPIGTLGSLDPILAKDPITIALELNNVGAFKALMDYIQKHQIYVNIQDIAQKIFTPHFMQQHPEHNYTLIKELAAKYAELIQLSPVSIKEKAVSLHKQKIQKVEKEIDKLFDRAREISTQNLLQRWMATLYKKFQGIKNYYAK
jgi:hypothetical protein